MMRNRLFVKVATLVSALVLICSPLFCVSAFAAPARIECVLKSEGAGGKDAGRKIAVVFDAEMNTLVAYQGDQRLEFKDVTISTVSINGATGDTTIGIDRSSWSIVVQTYAQDHVSDEFGPCKPAATTKP
jgi:hypothetical protein